MDVLVSGLNSYVGRRAASHLGTDDFHVHALIRDIDLFRAKSFEPITANLFSLDLLKTDEHYLSFKMDKVDMGIYFTQSPYFGDRMSLHVELTRLKNFIELLRRNLCDRILFIARLMDKSYITYVQQIFEQHHVKYTIVLKNIALGKESLADRYFKKLLQDKYIWYDEALACVEFRPVFALDLLRWIRNVDWSSNFINQIIEFGGVRKMSVRELFRMYKKLNHVENVGFPIPHFLYKFFFRKNKSLHKDDVLEIQRMFAYEYPVDNSCWAKRIPFSFTPIEEAILNDK